MARREYSEKDNWLISLLRKAGGVSQPSVPGRPNLPGVPTQKYRPVYSGSGRAGREAARDKALMDRYLSLETPQGIKGALGLEKNPAYHRALKNFRTNVGRPSDPALEEAMAPFKDLAHGERLDRSRRRIEEEVPQGRWPQRNPNIPVGSYAEPMSEYDAPPLEARGQSQERDEWGHRESDYEDDPSIWKKAWADWDRKKEYNRKMQQEGNFMHISGDEFPTVEERMEAREPGPLENAIIESLASKKRKKK